MQLSFFDTMFDLPSDANARELIINLGYAQSKLEKSPLKQLRAA
jgi:ATP-dependent Clp protease ATP-binding subunit ClpX